MKRYWLRGMLIFLTLYVTSTLLLIPLGQEPCDFICLPYWAFPSFIVIAIIPYLWDMVPISLFTVIPVSIILYGFIGILLGMLYGKIKNRNKGNGTVQ